jgi:hypothetical protein
MTSAKLLGQQQEVNINQNTVMMNGASHAATGSGIFISDLCYKMTAKWL